MAETRKHQSLVNDPLARAVRAAIGDDVRPTEPGAKPASSAPAGPPTPKGSTLPGATLGSFTFEPAKPARSAGDDDAR